MNNNSNEIVVNQYAESLTFQLIAFDKYIPVKHAEILGKVFSSEGFPLIFFYNENTAYGALSMIDPNYINSSIPNLYNFFLVPAHQVYFLQELFSLVNKQELSELINDFELDFDHINNNVYLESILFTLRNGKYVRFFYDGAIELFPEYEAVNETDLINWREYFKTFPDDYFIKLLTLLLNADKQLQAKKRN